MQKTVTNYKFGHNLRKEFMGIRVQRKHLRFITVGELATADFQDPSRFQVLFVNLCKLPPSNHSFKMYLAKCV